MVRGQVPIRTAVCYLLPIQQQPVFKLEGKHQLGMSTPKTNDSANQALPDSSPAFTVQDGLQRPVLLCCLPRLVPVRGLEPLRCYHGNLNPTCLPITPYRHIKKKNVAGACMEVRSSRDNTPATKSYTRRKAVTVQASALERPSIDCPRTVEDVRDDVNHLKGDDL